MVFRMTPNAKCRRSGAIFDRFTFLPVTKIIEIVNLPNEMTRHLFCTMLAVRSSYSVPMSFKIKQDPLICHSFQLFLLIHLQN